VSTTVPPGTLNPAVAPVVPEQNPNPVGNVGQAYVDRRRELVGQIMALFRTNLASNYVATVNGPFYTLQFQALAERLADFQITASEVFRDAEFDLLRSEYLWEVLGSLVFPESSTSDGGIPVIDGDRTYRDFLRGMVRLLLMGATRASVQGGVELLTDATVTVVERFIDARTPGSEWTTLDTFSFDVLVEGLGGDPFTLRENVVRVLTALRPAHTLYTYANLLRDEITSPTDDAYAWSMSQYGYEDTRRYCGGAEAVRGTAGTVLASERSAFTDLTRTFSGVDPGAVLRISGGPNDGEARRVVSVRGLRVATDPTPRAYTTSPSGLTGVATVTGGDVVDVVPSADLSGCIDGEVITFAAGPNTGTYRIAVLLGNNGGPVGAAVGPCRGLRVAPCTLLLDRRLTPATGQTYAVDVDRLGVRTPQVVVGEDASVQFWT
jgi:hypothetical protein